MPDRSLIAISCPTADWCMAVDGAGDVVHYADGLWAPPELIDPGTDTGGLPGDGEFDGVSCPTATVCIVSHPNGVSHYRHGTWSAAAASSRHH